MALDPLVRKKLPPDWVDLAVGEAHVVRDALRVVYPPALFELRDVASDCDYQAPEGCMRLVMLLEERYNGHVIVTSGAKQGLLAVFYALKKLGQTHISMRSPYWSQMPEAIALAGLGLVLGDGPTWGTSHLIVSPNNPDGHIITTSAATKLWWECNRYGTFLIHDAAYHTAVYLGDQAYNSLAGTAIYSTSKMYGLSGLRMGWVVTDDDRIARLAKEYVEASSVGVSLLSQEVVANIVEHEKNNPDDLVRFCDRARRSLDDNKRLVQSLSPEVLDTSDIAQHGIFGWFRPGPKYDSCVANAKVRIPPGSAFGDPNRVRINLAVDKSLLKLAVDRLNSGV